MAIGSLQNQLDEMAKIVKKKVFRNTLALFAQQIEYTYKQMFDELKSHYYKVGGVKQPTVQAKLDKDNSLEKVLENYVEEAINGLIKGHTDVQGMQINSSSAGKELTVIAFPKDDLAATLFGSSTLIAGVEKGTPYSQLSDIRTKVLNGIVAKNQRYRDLFWEGKQLKGYDADGNENKKAAGLNPATYSMGKAINLGHVTGVTFETLTAMDQTLPDSLGAGSTEPMSAGAAEDWKEVEQIYGDWREAIAEFSLGLDFEAPKFDFEKGTVIIQQDKVFLLKGEGAQVNVRKDKEQKAKGLTGAGLKKVSKALKDFYRKHNYLERSGSKSARQRVRDELLSSPKLRKLTKSAAAKKWSSNKKNDPPMRTSLIGKQTVKATRRKGQALNSTKGKARQPGALKSSGSGDSIASLAALLNQKLPQTVAKNMGPPGLENRTGRFAGSVRVTDVSRTPQGFPSVGYSYEKNPYQVFEMGRGDPRWATPDRDPRKLIDASMREIAAQLAIGRFYTRRI